MIGNYAKTEKIKLVLAYKSSFSQTVIFRPKSFAKQVFKLLSFFTEPGDRSGLLQ